MANVGHTSVKRHECAATALARSVIGRQFKTVVQTGAFHVHNLTTKDQFVAWKAVGELSALLWVIEFRNPAEYVQDLKVAAANVLDIVGVIDPSKILTKIKYHIVSHTPDDAVQMGPLVGVATEGFKSYHAVFRNCSIFSNHLAPSRDIALQLGRQESLKHRLTGGKWQSIKSGEWHGAGLPGVRCFIEKHPILQRLVGWTPEKVLTHGTRETKLVPLKRGVKERPIQLLETTIAARALNYGEYEPKSVWKKCSSVVSESLEQCSIDSWVFAQSDVNADAVDSGRICEILVNVLAWYIRYVSA
ncbi:hypothetical protein GGX14DRAFT_567586 [Mycena pura]|uniref:Uncharacterized protein n=1 Tax=Mycena pura TaxID=153505 RepID=A0AAD6VCW2_9AGAR|nr:hypothetical protein GGX14DRAFT_567586 [Mycena pura]